MTDTDKTPRTDDEILNIAGIPLLIYIQKSGSVLPETHLHWMKNNLDVNPDELTVLYSRTIDILIKKGLVRERPLNRLYGNILGPKRTSGLTEKGYELIQPYCIERDIELSQIKKDKLYSNREKPPAKVRGDKGEMTTMSLLKETAFPKYCRYVMNVTAETRTKPCRRTEIDILFVSTSGIIVIENKELNGTLQGSANDNEWKFTGLNKDRFVMVKNPIIQNREQIKVLNSICALKKTCYHSVSVVPENTQIKINGNFRKNEYLVHRNELIPTVIKIMKSEQDIWTNEEVNKIVETVIQ